MYMPVSKIDFSSANTKHSKLVEKQVVPCASLPSSVTSSKLNIPETSNEEQLNFFNNIALCSTKPVILSIVPKHSTSYLPKKTLGLPKSLTTFFCKDFMDLSLAELQNKCKAVSIVVSGEKAKAVELETKEQSSSPVWYQQRSGRITASHLYAVCRTNPESPSKSLIKGICYPGLHKFSSAATNWGINHEKEARAKYEMITTESHENFTVSDSGLHINPKWPFMGASPDGLVDCNCCGKGICEIKYPYSLRYATMTDALGSKAFCLEECDTTLTLKKKHAYYYQVQMQLLITDADYCDFIVWTLKDIYIQRLFPDNILWTDALAKATNFFKDSILLELVVKWYTRPFTSSDATHTLKAIDDEEVWCYCQKFIPDTTLIGCDNNNCKVQWFHMTCIGLDVAPTDSWFCPTCKQNLCE